MSRRLGATQALRERAMEAKSNIDMEMKKRRNI